MRGTKRVLFGAFSAAAMAVVLYVLCVPVVTSAAINQQISFQGKLVNPADGTNIANGSYSIRFRIYTDPSADSANACSANSCKWEDTQSITVTDGTFYYALGSNVGAPLPGSVDFNGSALYLGIKVGADLEMTPRIQFTAAPYAFNSNMLGGITAAGFLQLAPSTAQADASASPSIFVNDTGGGNLLQLQTGGGSPVNQFIVGNTGAVTAASTIQGTSLNGTTGINTGAAGGTQRIDVNGNLVNIGNITGTAGVALQSGGTGILSLASAAQTAGSTNSANITITTGNASGATSNAGNITLDVGTSNNGPTVGAIQIGTAARQQTITIGNATAGTTLGLTAAAGISLNSNTTVTGTNTFTVNAGATSLTGAAAGSQTALAVTSGAASNKGIRVTMTGASTTALEVFSGVTSSVVATLDNGGDFYLGATGVTGLVGSPDVSTASTNSSPFVVSSGKSTTSGSTGTLTLQSGNATSGTSGNVSIDNGTFTSGTPQITLGSSNARAISLGNNTAATTVAVLIGNTAAGFSVQATGSNQVFNVDASANDVVNVGNATNGASFKNYQSAGNSASFVANAAPTIDQVSITNAGQPVTTAGVNGLSVNYVGGAAAVEAAGMRIDYTPGGTTGGTWSGMRIVEGAAAGSGVNSYGLKLEGGGTGAGNSYGVEVASGWDIGIDVQSGGLQLATQTDPSAPAAGNLRIYARDIAGRIMPKWVGPSGVDTPFQASLGFNRVSMAIPNGTANCSTGFTLLGLALTGAGTCTAPAPTTTNLKTSIRRVDYSTGTTAGTSTYQRANTPQVWRGNAPGLGGFFFTTRFGMSTTQTNNRVFVGMNDIVANPTTNIDYSTSTASNKIGMVINLNTGNWKFMTNTAGTAPTVTDLGATIPVNTTDLFELVMFSAPNGTSIGYRVTDITTGNQVSGSVSANLPSNTVFLSPFFYANNNATGAAVILEHGGWYLESDN